MTNLVNWINGWFNPEQGNPKKYKDTTFSAYNTPAPFERIPKVTQQKLDAILDKINQQGIEQLTEEEKEFLRKASE
jgi:hypothetical protein